MRVYPLHNLHDGDFENLTTLICVEILGSATIPFAKGKDGGRDGRFHGTANQIPSSNHPWGGKIVIQAKHTTRENASCSDSTFSTILKNEVVPAIIKLKEDELIDYYLLFTNRKMTGIRDRVIEKFIEDETGIPNLVIASEKIQQYLQTYPSIVRAGKLNDLLRPLQFDESDLKEIIVSIHKSLKKKSDLSIISIDFTNIDLPKKNELNNLSKSYFENVVKRDFDYFTQIRNFFSLPINEELAELYDDTVSELNAKISLRRDEFIEFENLLDEFYNYVISNDTNILRGKKRLVRTILNYMYCNCDIGKKK